MTYQAEVRLSADPTRLQAGLNAAGQSVGAAFDRMRNAMASFGSEAVRANNDASGAFDRSAAAAARGRDELGRFTAEGNKMAASMEAVKGKLGGVITIFGAFAALKGMAGLSDQAQLLEGRLTDLLGSVQEARSAKELLYGTAQRLMVPVGDLSRSFARMLPAIQQMGGGVAEASKLSEILAMTARLSGASTEEASSAAIQFAQALGSGALQGDELRSILENNQTLARTLAGSLGVTVGELRKLGEQGKLTSDKVATALLGSYDLIKSRTNELPVTIGGAWTQITNAIARAVEKFEAATGVFSAIGKVLLELAKVIEIVGAQFAVADRSATSLGNNSRPINWAREIGRVFAIVVDYAKAVVLAISAIGQTLDTVIQMTAKIAQGDFTGAWQTMATGFDGAAKKLVQAGRNLVGGVGSVFAANEAVSAAEGTYSNEGRSRPARAGGLRPGKKGADDGAGGKAKSQMGEFETELSDARLASELKGIELAVGYEVMFWEQKLQVSQRGSAQYLAVQRKLVEAQIRQAREARAVADDVEKMTSEQKVIELQMAERREMAVLEQMADNIRLSAEKSTISRAEEFEALEAIEIAKYRVQANTMQSINLLKSQDIVTQTQYMAEVERLEQQHQDRIRGIRAQAQRAQNTEDRKGSKTDGKEEKNPWLSGVENSFQTASRSILNRAQSLKATLGNIFMSIGDTMLQQLVVKPLAGIAAGALQHILIETGLQKALDALFQSGSVSKIATKTAETSAVVSANAAQAASGAAASQAGIPIVGPYLAIAAAGSMLAFVGALASARGGYDIPAGVNPITQLHEKEMVLPAAQADVIRGMAEGAGVQTRATAVNINISAVDRRGVERLLKDNAAGLASAVQRGVRDGYRA